MPGVKQSRDGAVGILILNEPASLNAMTPDLLGGLATAIGELTADPTIRSLVLTGEGRGFCSGQNLKASEALGQDIVAGVMKFYWPAFKALRECRVPVVIAVNGVAAGGGFSLAMAGDMIVAARSASFIQVFSRIALVPDLGSTWLLPRLVGQARARGLALLAEPLSAEKAEQWGLIWKAVDDASLMAEAEKLCVHFSTAPTFGLGLIKRALDAAEDNDLSAQLDLERNLQREAGSHPNYREGVQAFLQKRKPSFSGKR